MLWAMCHGGDQPDDGSMAEEAQGMDEFDWVMKVSAATLPFSEILIVVSFRIFTFLTPF